MKKIKRIQGKLIVFLFVGVTVLSLAACGAAVSTEDEEAQRTAVPATEEPQKEEVSVQADTRETEKPVEEEIVDIKNAKLYVEGRVFCGTEKTGPMGDSSVIGGKISSAVGADEIPQKEGESNFGCIGNSYTKSYGEDWIMVSIGEEWYVFEEK
ncbi:hypothetical protein D7V86_16935 [bacterium D16-51]|nr:hypothetical protein D7V96_11990 [bacterium D16-59]RKI57699.1 hypothetical protein D7V86_16935 [bacterium D16-51]